MTVSSVIIKNLERRYESAKRVVEREREKSYPKSGIVPLDLALARESEAQCALQASISIFNGNEP